jgi:hypothetical protein
MTKIVTIHQPDFLPWIGLFYKINAVDHFFILDHVTNNPKDSAFWGRRVKMIINGNAEWISIPLKKSQFGIKTPISCMEVNTGSKEYNNTYKTIIQNYKKHPYYNESSHILEEYFDDKVQNLSDKNTAFITKVLNMLEIMPVIEKTSQLDLLNATNNDLLIELVQRAGGTHYKSGNGAQQYMRIEDFHAKNIEVIYNDYTPKKYKQKGVGEFINGLSILDLLFNQGVAETKKFFSSGKTLVN